MEFRFSTGSGAHGWVQEISVPICHICVSVDAKLAGCSQLFIYTRTCSSTTQATSSLLGNQSWTKHCWTAERRILPAMVSLCLGLHYFIELRQVSGSSAASESNDYSDIFWRGVIGQVHKCVLTNGEEFRWEEKCSILCSGPSHTECSELEHSGSADYIFSVLVSSEYQFDGVLIHHRFLWVRMMHGCPDGDENSPQL